MNISESRKELYKHIDNILTSYNNNIENNNNTSIIDKNTIKDLSKQVKIHQEEIIIKDNLIRELNKKSYDYENIINNYQKKMQDIEKEQEQDNKVSLVISQANEIEKLQKYIDQLESRIKNMNNKKQSKFINNKYDNISVDNTLVDKSDDNASDDNTLVDKSYDNSSVDNTSVDKSVDNKSNDNTSVDNKSDDNTSVDNTSVDNKSDDNTSEEEITYKRITYKKKKYFIIDGSNPQLVYNIDKDGDPGEEIGVRNKIGKNKYEIIFK